MADESLPLFPIYLHNTCQIQPRLGMCVVCKHSFVLRRRTQMCCSRACRNRYDHPVITEVKNCDCCGMVYLPKRRWQKYCCTACREVKRSGWTPERKAYQQSLRELRNEQQRQRLAKMSRAQKLLPGFNSRYKACLTLGELEDMLVQQNTLCACCGDLLDKWEIDHIVARGNGGMSTADNLQLLCRPCNVGKWTMTVDDYIAHCTKVADFQRKARAAGADIPEKPRGKKSSRASY